MNKPEKLLQLSHLRAGDSVVMVNGGPAEICATMACAFTGAMALDLAEDLTPEALAAIRRLQPQLAALWADLAEFTGDAPLAERLRHLAALLAEDNDREAALEGLWLTPAQLDRLDATPEPLRSDTIHLLLELGPPPQMQAELVRLLNPVGCRSENPKNGEAV